MKLPSVTVEWGVLFFFIASSGAQKLFQKTGMRMFCWFFLSLYKHFLNLYKQMHDSTKNTSKMVELWLKALYPFLDSWSLKMEPIGCPETSVRNYDFGQHSAVLTLVQLLPCEYVFGGYLVRISSELPVFLTVLSLPQISDECLDYVMKFPWPIPSKSWHSTARERIPTVFDAI